MIDIIGDWVIVVASYLSIILTGGCFAFLTKDYVRKPAFAIYAGMAYSVTMSVMKIVPYSISNITAYGLGVIISTIVLCIADRRILTMKLFLATTFFSIRWLVAAIEVSAFTLPVGSLVTVINEKQNSEVLALAIFILRVLLDIAMELFLMLTVIFVLNRYFKCKTCDMSWKEWLMLCSPSICAVLGYCVKIMYRDTFFMQTQKSIDDYLGTYAPVAVAYYICSILSIFVVIILFQELKLRQEETMHRTVLHMQLDDMRNSIDRVEKNYDKIRALRHDMGNHIQILKDMVNNGQKLEADAYITKLEEAYHRVVPISKTGNPITDIILDEKYADAKEKGVRMELDFHFPTGTNADAFDIGIILSNAVDNAIESADPDKPVVSVYSKRRNDILLICVENSFDGRLILDDKTGLPKTNKDGDGHGWGLVNMKNCAKKYYGDINIEMDGDKVVFCAMLSLNCNHDE
ncbi:MAG: ATP-binding protein [Lachnospiraceae bacterium]|nr:ATP-binding protein [Lachnospiraceae bacterium]